MRRFNSLVGCLLLLALSGCIRSLKPFFTEKDIAYDEKLAGTWSVDGNGKELWTFKSAHNESYNVMVSREGKEVAEFKIHLFKIQDRLFLDFSGVQPDAMQDWDGFLAYHFITVHTCASFQWQGDDFRIALLDVEHVVEDLHKHPDVLKHHQLDQDPINTLLIEDTEKIQAYIMTHIDRGLVKEKAYTLFSKQK
ncbi:MAG: hypothetical protein AAF492_25160 [Verrucomicrobiota bacterium]